MKDKRGLEIKVGDTLVGGCGEGDCEFIEVEDITTMQIRCAGADNAPVIIGRDLDGDVRHIFTPYKYISVCACYRDAKGEA